MVKQGVCVCQVDEETGNSPLAATERRDKQNVSIQTAELKSVWFRLQSSDTGQTASTHSWTHCVI